MSWFSQHRPLLEAAVDANAERGAFVPFQESPSRRHHPEGAREAGLEAYEARLGSAFDLGQQGVDGQVGAERSPWTGAPLGVGYGRCAVGPLMDSVLAAWPAWRSASLELRAGVCLEILHRWQAQAFENAYATQHTTGQGFLLAFAGSGAASLDRGLEALAAAWSALHAIPSRARWQRRILGRDVVLEKRYRRVPVGVAVVLSCGSYPAWNVYPALMANLMTGNPVVLKPHPDTLLPMAIAVETARAVLEEAGFDPNLLVLAPDTWEQPIAMELLGHSATAICDFTGGQRFGAVLERSFPRLQVYTETAGCNAVLLESSRDLGLSLKALAEGLFLFSAQMCTAPQNIWIPSRGVLDGGRQVCFDEVVAQLVLELDELARIPAARSPAGCLHSSRTLDDLEQLAGSGGTVVRASAPLPESGPARTASPLPLRLSAQQRALAQREHFGPMAFVIEAPSREEALEGAASDARRFGAIASYAWSVDADWCAQAEERFSLAGASLGLNLHHQRPINTTAAFSDFHVTGLNPAGTACLTDPAFVSRRFRVVQTKQELPCPEPTTS